MSNQTRWILDQSHSEIAFKVKHLMIAYVKGTFKIFDANIYTTAKDFSTAEIDVWLDASSITTGDAKRDAHLKGSDFLDVENHKQISFTASTIGKADPDGNHEVWGELTIKGITKNVKLNVLFGGIAMDPMGNEKAGFTVTGKINRKEWELTWNASLTNGGILVSEEVFISCDVELTNAEGKELTMEMKSSLDHEVSL